MDDIGFLFLGLACTGVTFILPIVAIIFAVQDRGRLRRVEVALEDLRTDNAGLQRQLNEVRARLAATSVRLAAAPAAPALAASPAPAAAPEVAAAPPEPEAPAQEEAQPVVRGEEEPPPMPQARIPTPAPAPAPAPAPEPAAAPTPELSAAAREGVEDTDEAVLRAPWSFERVAVWMAAAGGGSALVLAGLYFFALAVQEGWVSPAARYALGLAVGAGLVVSAEVLWSRRYQTPAAGLTGAGIGVLYGALYAGTELYSLVPHSATFVMMALVTAVSTLLANRHRSLFLAMLGGLGGFMTPILLSTGENRAVALFARK